MLLKDADLILQYVLVNIRCCHMEIAEAVTFESPLLIS